MTAPQRFVDLHLHAEGLPDEDLKTLAYFGLAAAVTCAHDPGALTADELRHHWDELVNVQTMRLRACGIRPLVALALHPSRLPWHGVDDLLHRLPRYFDDSRVVALGELGLQAGGEREEEVLLRQLELAARIGKPAILHTPALEKRARTKRVLALVKEAKLDPARVLIDHVSAETYPLVRGMGCWAGLTIQPGSLDAEEAATILSRNGAADTALTSDLGEGASDLLALPRAAETLRRAGLSAELSGRVLLEGPLAFLGYEAVGDFLH